MDRHRFAYLTGTLMLVCDGAPLIDRPHAEGPPESAGRPAARLFRGVQKWTASRGEGDGCEFRAARSRVPNIAATQYADTLWNAREKETPKNEEPDSSQDPGASRATTTAQTRTTEMNPEGGMVQVPNVRPMPPRASRASRASRAPVLQSPPDHPCSTTLQRRYLHTQYDYSDTPRTMQAICWPFYARNWRSFPSGRPRANVREGGTPAPPPGDTGYKGQTTTWRERKRWRS